MKSKTIATLLCFFLGIFGIHRFHLGHTLIGVIQLLTLGCLGIWPLIDFFRLIFGSLQVNHNGENEKVGETVIEDKISVEDAISVLEKNTKNNQTEFENAFDVLTKFEGKRWNLLKSMKSFPFLMIIFMVIGQVYWHPSPLNPNMPWVLFLLLFLLLFLIKYFKKLPSKVNLSLADEHKEKLTIILEFFKKVKIGKSLKMTKVLNYGTTEIAFPKVKTMGGGNDLYFLPEGIAYKISKSEGFKLANYNNLSVKKTKQEVLKGNLPKYAKVVDKRKTREPVYGGWTHQNKDGSKDSRYKNNPRKIISYDETEYLTYIETLLEINNLKIKLIGDYNFPSLKTKNEKQEEEEKRMEQERIKKEKEKEEKEKRMEQERIKKEKEKEERDRKQEWERGVTDKLANVSVSGKSKGNIIKELSDGNLSNEQRSYLESIVQKRIEGDKKEKEQEYIQNKKDFFQGNKLTVMEKGNKGDTEYPKMFIRDENYEEYELEEERMDFIVYKPEGMKGKRAYIKTDSDKNYLEWSGPIAIEDKSRFLRGDLDKIEEESQPKEEAPVQEKENVEVKQGKELESSDSNLDISERLEKLTKLYEEGELNEEEYQQKTNALLSKM